MVKIEFEYDGEDGWCTAYLADLPVQGEGATLEDAVAELKTAVRAYLAVHDIETEKYRDWCQT